MQHAQVREGMMVTIEYVISDHRPGRRKMRVTECDEQLCVWSGRSIPIR